MTMFMLQPGDCFTFTDVFEPTGRAAFGIVLENRTSLVIRGDGALVEFTAQRTRLPHNAVPLDGNERMPAEIRLALAAVNVALSLRR